MIVKARTGSLRWLVYNKTIGATKYLVLNTNAALGTLSTEWNNTEPTSTNFTLGVNSDTNLNGTNFIAYLFASIEGFSKVGSYTGNGSADGPYLYCGFKPKYFMYKVTDTTGNWIVLDTERLNRNPDNLYLSPDVTTADSTAGTGWNGVDILSNGIKIKSTVANWTNASGKNYLYMAFAESPFKYATAR